jgi:hypothetical protein
MLALSEAASAGVEYRAMATWLPGLRNGALLELGVEIESWCFDGPDEQRLHFFEGLWGNRNDAKKYVASLLGCCLYTAKRQLRFHSEADVEFLSDAELPFGNGSRSPRFVIDSRRLADRIREVCGPHLFTAELAN